MSGPERTSPDPSNVDEGSVRSFGRQWTRYDQGALPAEEHRRLFANYFRLFPWDDLPDKAVGFDLGCGSGRWAALVAPRVGHLYCIDPSADALAVARERLREQSNCTLVLGDAANMGIPPASMDFGYSLGVLHHLPHPEDGLVSCVRTLKPGAPFLVYVYYALEARPWWYRLMFSLADVVRRIACSLPERGKVAFSVVLAATVYWPLARTSLLLERARRDVSNFPLAYYRRLSFYTMRTDARDRFGTPVEQRFSRGELYAAMERAGLAKVTISDEPPFWCAVAYRAG